MIISFTGVVAAFGRGNGLENPGDARLIDCLTHEDLFALCIAAVGHDVGHPGLTNAFMVSACLNCTIVANLFSTRNTTLSTLYALLEKRKNTSGRSL